MDFSAPSDMSSRILEEDIVAKQEEFQTTLQQFHRQCKINELKLELKLAAGFSPKTIAVEDGRSTNARWIVLESHFKKDRIYIYDHVGCNIAVMKRNNVLTTIIPYMTMGRGNKSRKLQKQMDLLLLDQIAIRMGTPFVLWKMALPNHNQTLAGLLSHFNLVTLEVLLLRNLKA